MNKSCESHMSVKVKNTLSLIGAVSQYSVHVPIFPLIFPILFDFILNKHCSTPVFQL